MPNPGFIRGTHHLTFCVGGAQEDYDFHVRLLGLRSVKKTVLFDGEIPIYHLYYGNGAGDPSTLLTAFPYRQAGWMGKRGTNQAKILLLSVPVNSIGYWSDRFKEHGVDHERIERFRTERLLFRHPCGIEYALVGDPEHDTREPYDARVPAEHAIRGAYGTTTSVTEQGPMDYFIVQGMNGEPLGDEGENHQYQIGEPDGFGRMLELVEEPDLHQGTWHFGEGTIHHQAFDVGDRREPAGGQGPHRRAGLHRRLGGQGPRLLLLHVLPQPQRAAGGARLRARPRAFSSTRPRRSWARTCASRPTGSTAAGRSTSSSRSRPRRPSSADRSSADRRRCDAGSPANTGAMSV